MKWILPISLIILLSFINTFDRDNKAVNEKTIKKMVGHLTKIRNLVRNLEDDTTTDDESEPSKEEEESEIDSSTPNTTDISTIKELLPAPVVKTDNKKAKIHILSFNSFTLSGNTISFNSFFMFNDIIPPKVIYFELTFVFRERLRNLEGIKNETAKCSIEESSEVTESAIFNCEATNTENKDFVQIVVNPGIKLDNNQAIDLGEINYSEDSALALQNLQKQNQKINKIYILNNGELKEDPKWNYFIINGDINKFNGGSNDNYRLEVYDTSKNGNDKVQSVSCKLEQTKNIKYKFKCTPDENLKGKIDLSPMFIDNKHEQVTLNMITPSQEVNFNANSQTNNNNSTSYQISRKSSSGSSAGLIAGIVIASVIVFIIVTIIIIHFKPCTRPPPPPNPPTPPIVITGCYNNNGNNNGNTSNNAFTQITQNQSNFI